MHSEVTPLTDAQLRHLVEKLTDANPLTVLFINSARIHLERRFPEVHHHFYVAPSSLDRPLFLFAWVENPFCRHYVVVTALQLDFRPDDYVSAVRSFLEQSKLVPRPRDGIMFVGPARCTDIIKEMAADLWPEDVELEYNLCRHYVSSLAMLRTTTPASAPKLHDGYVEGEPNSEKHGRPVMETWRHSQGEPDVELCKVKLRRMPCALIFEKADVEMRNPVGYVLTDFIGSMSHHYVLADHRRKGLGNVLEWRLVQRMLDANLVPAKSVRVENKTVVDATERTKWWRRLEDNDGEPIPFYYLGVGKNDVQ